MKGDFTRDTFDSTKHYQKVLMQQGRVQLDADWNEQAAIAGRRDETTTEDIVGHCGGPAGSAAFGVLTAEQITAAKLPQPAPNDFYLSAGRYYINGIQCELEKPVLFRSQPDRVQPDDLDPAKNYLLYLDVWQRHITALDNKQLLDPALNGVDTATRVKTIWQVRAFEVANPLPDGACGADFDDFKKWISPSTMQLTARTEAAKTVNDPCQMAEDSGYKGLENQLYRVEIHEVNGGVGKTLKWSRENGSVISCLTGIDAGKNELTLESLGHDNLNFEAGQFVEILDDALELEGKPGQLIEISEVREDDRVLVLKEKPTANFASLIHPKVRRWDGRADLKSGRLPLEAGIEVQLSDVKARCHTGDYWLIPARAATANSETGDIEWPRELTNGKLEPIALAPRGITHHFCRLGFVIANPPAGQSKFIDCRCLWPQLAAPRLVYVSGDGQEVMPDLTTPNVKPRLPQPLIVGAFNGQCSDGKIQLRFKCKSGAGQLALGQLDVPPSANPPAGSTDEVVVPAPNGLVLVHWWLENNSSSPAQQVECSLVDVSQANSPAVAPPLRFNANLSIASEVAYQPDGCTGLAEQKTVQAAISRLASMASLYKISGDGQQGTPGKKLASPLVVIAANRCGRIEKADIAINVISGGGSVSAATASNLPDGSAAFSFEWTLGDTSAKQEVEARFVGTNGQPVTEPGRVRFAAFAAVHVLGVSCLDKPLLNDTDLSVSKLVEPGIKIQLDQKVESSTVTAATCFVTLEIPYPMSSDDQSIWGTKNLVGFQPLVLQAAVKAVDKNILWFLDKGQINAISKMLGNVKDLFHRPHVLARLTLKGNFVWRAGHPVINLDGETFGRPGQQKNIDLDLEGAGNGVRGGDFEMWFWLTAVEPPLIVKGPESHRVLAGSNTTFGVVAKGTESLTYQWKKDGASLQDGGNISGTKTPTLAILNAKATDAGLYSVIVSNIAGNATGEATLTVA